MQRISDGCDDARRVEEIDLAYALAPVLGPAGSGPDKRDRLRFTTLLGETIADFEELDVPPAAPDVSSCRLDETRKKRRPKHRERLRQRISDRHDRLAGDKRLRGRRRRESKSDGLGEALTGREGSKLSRANEPRVHRRRRHSQCGKCDRNSIEPVMARYFLDQIDLARHIHTPCWDRYLPASLDLAKRKAEGLEHPSYVGVGDGQAKQTSKAGSQKLQHRGT